MGIFHTKMDKIKGRNGMDLTEKKILRRGGKNTQKNCMKKILIKIWKNYTLGIEVHKKGLNDLDNHDGVLTHVKADILKCEVKWALGRIATNKASDGIPAELFQVLNDDAMKMLHSICQQIWKTQQWPQDWKRVRFYSNPNERQCQRMFKLLHNCTFVSHANKVIPKILQARLQHTWTENFQMSKLDLEKAEEPEIKLLTTVKS